MKTFFTGGNSPLLHSCQTPPVLLHSDLGYPASEGNGLGVNPVVEDHIRGLEHGSCEDRLRELGLLTAPNRSMDKIMPGLSLSSLAFQHRV